MNLNLFDVPGAIFYREGKLDSMKDKHESCYIATPSRTFLYILNIFSPHLSTDDEKTGGINARKLPRSDDDVERENEGEKGRKKR